MNSILRALAARWPLILVTTLASLLGGVWVTVTSAPRYQGSARVVLDYIRPDPTTGEVVSSKMLDAYLTSQIRMLKDQQVAVPAAEILGWMDSPDVLAAYANRPASDTRDLGTWVSGILIPRIGARMVEGSNILEISYYGESEELSRVAADAIRTAYIQSDVEIRQSAARENAAKLEVRLAQIRTQLDALRASQRKASQESGVMLDLAGRDQDSAQLAALLDGDARPIIKSIDVPPSLAARELAQVRGTLNASEQSLGPNHPSIREFRQREQALTQRVALEATSMQSQRQLIDAASAASQAQIDSLIARILAQREPALRLKLLQDQINAREEEARSLAEAVIASRAVQSTRSTAISPIGEAYAEPRPVFPNPLLILGGSASLGLVLGGMMACLVELAWRRVRNARHVESATGSVLLAVLPAMVVYDRHAFRTKWRATLRSRPVAASTE
jgi:succinoglycan biosynthesis transport protein ExoP